MFQLLREVPGIVVLHDFFLSQIREFMYSTQYINNPEGNFYSEVLDIHGLFSIVDFLQRGLKKAIWDWPLNWNVLKYARKVIVHSQYQNELLKKYYGRGWYPHTSIISQPHSLENKVSMDAREQIKLALGIEKDHFVFCSFGFLNLPKLNYLSIEAFANFLTAENMATFVFVGEPEKGEFEKSLRDLMQNHHLEKNVRITGFTDKETYRQYLSICDAAVQLRINSRGETSRAVLDCMSFGIPTIINAHGSLTDYCDGDVIKLSESPTEIDLAQAMHNVFKDHVYREKIGQNAIEAIRKNHHPEKVAAAYYEEILKASQRSDAHLFAPLVDAIMKSSSIDEKIQSVSRIASSNLGLRTKSRILIDVTNISYIDLRTGIQRVVKNLIRGLYSLADPSLHVELVRISEGKLYRSSRFAENLFVLPENSIGADLPVSIQPGDILFMLDTSWNLWDQYLPVFASVRKAGGKIVTMLYDMIPAMYPEFCTVPTVRYFKKWIHEAVNESDEIICISKAVVDNLKEYIQIHSNWADVTCKVSFIHLGADIPEVKSESEVRTEVSDLVDGEAAPLFLLVGTVEPRKGHAYAIDAFEHLWGLGENYRLCIIGKIGWNVEGLEKRIRTHRELGKHLFFFDNATDAELNLCYSKAVSLIAPSIAEGFGLPIIEAALHRVPALVSDIPVFREVGGEGATYFSLDSPISLANAVSIMASMTRDERIALAGNIKVLTWKESAAWLLKILNNHKEDNLSLTPPNTRSIQASTTVEFSGIGNPDQPL